jgi:hypothetical protein
MLHYSSIGWLKTRQSLKRYTTLVTISFENKPVVLCHTCEVTAPYSFVKIFTFTLLRMIIKCLQPFVQLAKIAEREMIFVHLLFDNFLTTFSLIFTLYSYSLFLFLSPLFWTNEKRENESCH